MSLAHAFFRPLGIRLSSAMSHLSDEDLAASHRVFTAMVAAMTEFEQDLISERPQTPVNLGPSAKGMRRRQGASPESAALKQPQLD